MNPALLHAQLQRTRGSRRLVRGALFATAALGSFFVALTTANAQSLPRTAFVHLFEWKWTDVARECETYLGPKGFAAVQVSPPNEHNWVASGDGAPFPWWMRYQAVSYRLDRSRSGTRAEFVDMVARCKGAGVDIYVDAVVNHMSGGEAGVSSAGNAWSHHSYPGVPYGDDDFHAVCAVNDYGNAANVQQCELSGLQDLKTELSRVRGRIADYLVDLANLGVRGFRVDAAKHVNPADLAAIIDAVDARVPAKPLWYVEVIKAAGEAVQPDQYLGLAGSEARVLEFGYGPQLFGKFAGGGKLADLRTFGESWGLAASSKAVVFVDNHDKQRGHGGGGSYLTYRHGATYDLANVFMLAWPYGYPQVMSSYAFSDATPGDRSRGPPFGAGGATRGPWDGADAAPACFDQAVGGWVCEHRFRPIGNMVGFRNATRANPTVTDWWDNGGNLIAFGRGDQGFVVINHENQPVFRSFATSLPGGRYCDVISGELDPGAQGCSGNLVVVDASGAATIAVPAQGAAAIHVDARVAPGVPNAEWFFRGTPNAWGAAALRAIGDNRYRTCQRFASGDGFGRPRFKIDHLGDWAEAYPATDYLVSGGKSYVVDFRADTHRIVVTEVPVCAADGGSASAATTLGAVWAADKTVFSLWSPEHTEIRLVLDGVAIPMSRVADFNGYTEVYQAVVTGDHHLKKYHFVVDGVAVRDPYGRMAEPGTNDNVVIDLRRAELPGGWSPRPPLAARVDSVIYETHVRDFTINPNSGVSATKRGKFLGMVEAGTRHAGVPTGIDHLKELGVTHVQLMPVNDFGSCPDVADVACYNWGYDPRSFNVPEERYSQTPFDYENRVRELRTMVDLFHRAGIRVVLDVVYNHTFGNDVFEPITRRYYTAVDLSGTGNSIDADQPMVSRMIRDSLEYWVREYNVDGFRFDLIGIFSYAEVGSWAGYLNARFPDRNLLIYGEPWNGFAGDPMESERVRLGTVGRLHGAHVGVFNPKYREAIKGSNDDGRCNPGDCFAFNASPDTRRIEVGSRGAIRATHDASIVIDTWDPMFAMGPEQAINYVDAHDNLALRDKILLWADANGVARDSRYLRRIQQFANGIVLTSQGIPFLHGGVELMRDKQGNANSYASPDSVNEIDWQWKIANADVFDYHRQLIALRRANRALRLASWDEINQCVATERPRAGVVVHHVRGPCTAGERWKEAIIIQNSADNYVYPLPAGSWQVAVEKADPSILPGRVVSGSVVAEGTAVTVLYRE